MHTLFAQKSYVHSVIQLFIFYSENKGVSGSRLYKYLSRKILGPALAADTSSEADDVGMKDEDGVDIVVTGGGVRGEGDG
jgi:hypothetical protein